MTEIELLKNILTQLQLIYLAIIIGWTTFFIGKAIERRK